MGIHQMMLGYRKPVVASDFPYLYFKDTSIVYGKISDGASGFVMYTNGDWKHYRDMSWNNPIGITGKWRTDDLATSAYQFRLSSPNTVDSAFAASSYGGYPASFDGTWKSWTGDEYVYNNVAHSPAWTGNELIRIEIRTVSDNVVVSNTTVQLARN